MNFSDPSIAIADPQAGNPDGATQDTTPIIPVILCGGSGSRLWPLSRESFPKQFVPFFGDKSLFAQTLERLDHEIFADPIVVTHDDFRFLVDHEAAAARGSPTILVEPTRRDSGPAVAVAAAYVARSRPDALMLVMPSDHLVDDVQSFRAAIVRGAPAAANGWITTFGIQPSRPHTGYGYIKPGKGINAGVHGVSRFLEKPNAQLATEFLDQGYLWNSGMFLFRADALLEELARFEPIMAEAAVEAVERARPDLGFVRLDRASFERAPAKSIDVAVMERTDKAAVVPASFGWSDVGGWETVWERLPHDRDGNAVVGNATVVDSRNCLVRSDAAFTAVQGLEDLVVVVDGDAVMVTSREKSDSLKGLVQTLKQEGHVSVVHSNRVHRPWGYYQQLDRGFRYQVKRIVVNPGAKLSLQSHYHRAEHWVVVCGTAAVTRDGQEMVLRENESVYVPAGTIHRLANPGRIPLELIEVQSGSYLEEDDIIRFDDEFNRL